MKKIKKKQQKLTVSKQVGGDFKLFFEGFEKTVQIRAEPPWRKFELVRAAILEEGYVFAGKIEKSVRKELNFWD